MRLLPFRIGEGDLGPRLAQPKAQLPEQALALTHAQRDAVLLSDPDRQRFAIPQIAAQPGLPRRLAKSRADLFQLLLIQAPGPPSSLSLAQTYQALLLATANPILHRPRRVAQQPGHLGAGHSLGYQQHTVEAVVVAGILGASDLILQSEDDAVRVGYAQWSHALRRTHPVYYTQVLMTLCLDPDTGRVEILKSWPASPVEGQYMRTYRGRAFSTASTQLRWVDEKNLEYRIGMRIPTQPASERYFVSRIWNNVTNEMVEKDQWNQDWLAISGGSEPTLSGDWEVITAKGEEAFPCAIVALHSSSTEVRVLLKDSACDRVYPDGISPTDVEQYSRRDDIERVQDFKDAYERLTAEGLAAGMTPYEASSYVTRGMRELGYYPTPPQLVARMLSDQEVAALRREQALEPIFTIIEMQFTVGLFRDIEQAIRNPGQEFDKAGKYIIHNDYTTSQELNAALGNGVDQFYIGYSGRTYEMKIVKP